MEFLAMLYTVLLVAICLMMALLLFRSGRPTGGLDEATPVRTPSPSRTTPPSAASARRCRRLCRA